MQGLFLTTVTSPVKLEEFVHSTVPLLTDAGYQSVIDALEIQREYIEAHLKQFNGTQENWHRFAQNLWNSMPARLVERVASAIEASRKPRAASYVPAPLTLATVDESETGPAATEDNFVPTPTPKKAGRPAKAK
jgi:hypothetical protein